MHSNWICSSVSDTDPPGSVSLFQIRVYHVVIILKSCRHFLNVVFCFLDLFVRISDVEFNLQRFVRIFGRHFGFLVGFSLSFQRIGEFLRLNHFRTVNVLLSYLSHGICKHVFFLHVFCRRNSGQFVLL